MTDPLIFTLFGATGDLAQKKVLPALHALYLEKRLPEKFYIVAFSRRPWTHKEYHEFITPSFKKPGVIDTFLSHIVYAEGKFDDAASYVKLAEKIADIEKEIGRAKKLFYFAVKPEQYRPVLIGLASQKLDADPSSRILVEKPFGHDKASACELEKLFEQTIRPGQLLRIDHYLAKEGLRSLVETRRKNRELESRFNASEVASIHVRILESIGIEGRGEFYERIGALRDIAQNHLLEMLAVVLMNIEEKNENKARAEALRSLSLVGEPVLGQYEAYLEEDDVAPDSTTETYARFTVESSLARWKGVPIVLETGKAMSEKKSDIIIVFKNGSSMTFDMHCTAQGRDAYETVIEKAITDECEYFVSTEEVVAAWRTVDQIIKKHATLEVKCYPKGASGSLL